MHGTVYPRISPNVASQTIQLLQDFQLLLHFLHLLMLLCENSSKPLMLRLKDATPSTTSRDLRRHPLLCILRRVQPPEMAERSKMSLLRKFSANRLPVGSLPLCSGMTRAVDQW
mmetsp:Transcript_125930/g.298951  ORF Transcript_125930/g.298951 Transcript_125930/m.298951 type:complete len:114 (+) Transcript_125930:771-1112(+)